MNINELSEILKDYGIAGAGGAGFPAYGKLNLCADTIILNCAECEPLLKLHRHLLEKYAREILSTMVKIADVLEVDNILVGVKAAYKETLDALNSAIISYPKVKIVLLDEVYPAGDEVVLIYEATGRIVKPGNIPIEIGVIVYNVETVYNMYQALESSKPVTEKYITIIGEVSNPTTRLVPIGITVGEVLNLAGNLTTSDPVFIMGGPMTGRMTSRSDVITKTSNGIIVIDRDSPLALSKEKKITISMKRAMAACCQCEMCTDLCPRNMLGHPISPHLFMRNATSGVTRDTEIFMNTFYCSECGICEMYACPQGLAPRTLIGEYKRGLRGKGVTIPKIETEPKPNKARDYRKVPVDRLRDRLGLKKYDFPALIDEKVVTTNSVRILLSQHIGAPATPIVKVGDEVLIGQKIANAKEGALSLPVHASISGKVKMINDNEIIISK